MSSLAHHGVKGQKWGVRRYQNPDGTRTQAGKRRDLETRRTRRATKSKAIVDSIIASMNDDDRDLLNVGDDGYLSVEQGKYIAKRILVKDDKGEYVSFVDLLEDGDGLNGIVGTKSGDDYRGKGYASKAAKEALDWYDKNADKYGYTKLTVGAKKRNVKSQGLAEKSNFDKVSSDDDWVVYEYKGNKVKHSSIGGNMNYIYGNTLVMGDTSYLEHHGILGQKWGVRRFQNKDGTRTKAGKARDLKNTIVLKKGSTIKRTTPAAADWRNGRRMYVSIDNDDAKKWRDFFSRHYVNPHEHTYKVKRDLYIATGKEITDIINREFKSKADRQQFSNDVQKINLAVSKEKYRKAPNGIDQTAYDASSLMRSYSSPYSEYNTESGKRIVKALTDSGFDGLIDSFGQDVSKSPVILLDPEKKVKRKTTKSVREIQFQEAMGLMTHSSIGGNMNYIYGNTLVLGDSSYLAHHGILGQKWGIRRFQNPDGTRTEAGRKRYSNGNELKGIDNINKYKGVVGKDKKERIEILQAVAQDVITPFWSSNDGSRLSNAADLGVKALKKMEPSNFFSNEDNEMLKEWFLEEDQTYGMCSISDLINQGYSSKNCKDLLDIVKKNDPGIDWDDGDDQRIEDICFNFNLGNYNDRLKRFADYCESEKNSMAQSGFFVEDDTLYLAHHGIKNQKWGVRRFQNPDGSLTAAGRIRYGVTGAAKAAFKVGKKLGSATASAARAGVKKAKDNAYEKKKEKASQTREGVLKNKKMFTADELKALENRFKVEDEMSEARLRHGQAIAKTVSQYANTTRDVLSALQTGGNAVSSITKAFADIQSYKNAKGVAEAAKEKGMTTKEFDLFLKEKYPNAKKDDGSKKKDKDSNKTSHSDSDNNDDDNPPNNGGGGGSKKQAEYEAKRQAAQEATYAKRKADLDSRESGLKQREDYVNKRYDALLKVSKQRQSEQDARDEDLNRRDKAASERESKLKETAKIAADVMSKLNKRQADLDKKESFLNSIESYRLDTLSEFKKNEEEAARRKKKNAKHSAIGEEMYTDHLEHHGIKGQRWGVRRFQNADGSLTDKGRKHYQKKLTLEERKLTAANAARGRYERVRTPLSVGMGVVGAVAGAMVGVPAGPAGIAAGAAVVSSIAASSTYAEYTLKGVFAGHGANRSKKKIAKYKEALTQDAFEIQNGVLIYGSDRSGELEHFGLKGMKWGIRRFQNKDGSLTDAGKKRYSNTGELDGGGGGGGGAPEEEDEETKKVIEEAAKKAGMTVDEYRKKFADKVAALKEKARDAAKEVADTVYNEAGGKYKKAAAENNAAANRALREAAAKDMKAKESYHDYERLNERGAEMAASWAKSSAESYKKSADNSRYAHRMYKKNQAEANKRYKESLAGRVEATSRKIGAKAQEAKDKLKSRAPKRSIALEVTNTGPAPVGQTEIHTADLYNKYFGAVARARKTAANSTAAQRAKYGDRRNIRERAEAEELNNARAREKRDEAIRLRMAKKFDKKADSARAHGNTAKAKAFEKESNRQFNKAPISGSKAESFEAARDATLASHLVRNAATAKRAQSATLAENRNRNTAHLAERRRERSINEAKAKIRSGKLPVNELTRYAKSSVGQLKSAAKAELARREKEQALASMGSDYARATARVTTTSSTTNTTDAHNEKLARDRRDKRKQAAKVGATAKKNRLAGSGRKKYTSGQTSSIGRVGSGRGKTSTRR